MDQADLHYSLTLSLSLSLALPPSLPPSLPPPSSSPGVLRPDSVDVCTGIDFPGNVAYTVEVSASPRACQLPQPIRTQIEFIRFGTVEVDINLICDCECAQPVRGSGWT